MRTLLLILLGLYLLLPTVAQATDGDIGTKPLTNIGGSVFCTGSSPNINAGQACLFTADTTTANTAAADSVAFRCTAPNGCGILMPSALDSLVVVVNVGVSGTTAGSIGRWPGV